MSDGTRSAPASFGQRRLWFFDRLQPHNSIYNIHHRLPLTGAIDAVALEGAANEMMRRHEILRTTFRNVDGNPVQVIHPPAPIVVSLTDLSDLSEERRERELHRVLVAELMRGFDLERGPLLSLVLLRLEPKRHILSFVIHHIIFDDWSVWIFERELMACYADIKEGRPFSLPEVALQYAAFSKTQIARFDRTTLDPQLAYWRDQLGNLSEAIALPTDRPRPPLQTFPGSIRKFCVEPDVANGFRSLTRAANVTLFMSLFAAFAVLLSRYSGSKDIAVGTPITNRNSPELTDLVGFLVNTVVLRVHLDKDPSFIELLAQTREMALGALDNQDVPFELLVEDLRPTRDASRLPLVQTMFTYLPGRGPADNSGPKDIESAGAKFELALTAVDSIPNFSGELEYNTNLFDKGTIGRMAVAFETLLGSIVANPTCPISKLSLLPPEERRLILAQGRGEARAVPAALVHQIVAAIAAARPEAPAVSFGGTSLTYGALMGRAGAIAEMLRRLAVAPEVRIGLCLDRTPDWIVSMLGVLMAGCAMVPLDPALPPDRIAFMMEDAGVEIVLSERSHALKIPGNTARLICLDDNPTAGINVAETVGDPTKPGGLAYIIFTSGSTGRPKGVMVEHGGLANLALGQGQAWNIGPGARVLQFAASGFDAAMSEVFSTLCLGGHLHLASTADVMPSPRLVQTLRDLRITHVTLPPSGLAAMQPEALPDLAVVIAAGEACEPDLARRWAHARRFVNAYGPTEATVCATMHDYVDNTDDVPIGRPLPNVQVYVLDVHGEPVPPNVTGEIHIGGVGVARGYLNQPDLTRERFLPDPFSDRPEARLYRSGDLGRFDSAGTLHYLGRIDAQLKIRGYRIEPGEIESVMRLHPQVRDALVVGHGKGPDARLVAYFISEGTSPLVIELRGFLAKHLPDYMAPAAYIMVESWPKTIGGKIDRQALPRPDSLAQDAGTDFVEPANALEETVAAIWRDCLGLDQVGTSDNFFDLGGHSLLLVKVFDQLKERLKLDLSLIDMFRFPTIKLQAAMLEAKTANRSETETLGKPDQRAARQNAARQQRRQRVEIQRHV